MGCITPCTWWIIDKNRMKGLPTVSTGWGTSAINNTINNYRVDRTFCFFGFVSTWNEKKTDLRAWGTEWLREFSWILGSSVFPPKMIFCQKKRSTPWRVSAMVEKSRLKRKANEKNMCCLSLQHLCWNPAPIVKYGSALNCLSFSYFISFHIIQGLKMPREAQDGRKVCGVTFCCHLAWLFCTEKMQPTNRIHSLQLRCSQQQDPWQCCKKKKRQPCFPLKDCNTWMTKFVEKVDFYRKFLVLHFRSSFDKFRAGKNPRVSPRVPPSIPKLERVPRSPFSLWLTIT